MSVQRVVERVSYILRCDGCGRIGRTIEENAFGQSAPDMTDAGEGPSGWQYGKRDLCPECQREEGAK